MTDHPPAEPLRVPGVVRLRAVAAGHDETTGTEAWTPPRDSAATARGVEAPQRAPAARESVDSGPAAVDVVRLGGPKRPFQMSPVHEYQTDRYRLVTPYTRL